MSQDGLFDQIDNRKQAIKKACRDMKGQKLVVLSYFLCNDRWVNQVEAMDVFTERHSRWYIGPNYGRRLRELLEMGLLVSEIDPNKTDRTHRWRLNR